MISPEVCLKKIQALAGHIDATLSAESSAAYSAALAICAELDDYFVKHMPSGVADDLTKLRSHIHGAYGLADDSHSSEMHGKWLLESVASLLEKFI